MSRAISTAISPFFVPHNRCTDMWSLWISLGLNTGDKIATLLVIKKIINKMFNDAERLVLLRENTPSSVTLGKITFVV